MWSRAQLKGRAKATFKRNYWKCILISLLLTLIAGGSGAASGNLSSATGSLHGSDNQAGSSYDYDSSYDSDDGSLRDFEAGLEEGFKDGLKAGNRGMMGGMAAAAIAIAIGILIVLGKESVLMLGDGVINKTVPLILCAEENVVGNHGATIGELDDETLFYFESRGIGKAEAENILARAAIERLARETGDEETEKLIIKILDEDL